MMRPNGPTQRYEQPEGYNRLGNRIMSNLSGEGCPEVPVRLSGRCDPPVPPIQTRPRLRSRGPQRAGSTPTRFDSSSVVFDCFIGRSLVELPASPGLGEADSSSSCARLGGRLDGVAGPVLLFSPGSAFGPLLAFEAEVVKLAEELERVITSLPLDLSVAAALLAEVAAEAGLVLAGLEG